MATYDALIRGCQLPRHEATTILNHIDPTHTREWLIAHGDELANDNTIDQFNQMTQRRRNGYPLAYLVGWREFYGRRFRVNPSVLIPRPDTETLVQWAIENAPQQADVLELGTGSGVIAISIACERKDLTLTATDIDDATLQTARQNAIDNQCEDQIHWIQADWYEQLNQSSTFDLIVSNPPYIAPRDAHLTQGDLRYEPQHALVSLPDGLSAIRAIAAGATSRLKPRGWLALEHGYDQARAARAILADCQFQAVKSAPDMAGHWRITVGQKPPIDVKSTAID